MHNKFYQSSQTIAVELSEDPGLEEYNSKQE